MKTLLPESKKNNKEEKKTKKNQPRVRGKGDIKTN